MAEQPHQSEGQPSAAEVGVLAAPKACGQCSLCCKVLAIAELDKPRGTWCRHIARQGGCGIYPGRPDSCRHYQCAWTWAGPLDEGWRPDHAGFLIQPTPVASEIEIIVDPDRPDAWRREPYYSLIKQWSDRSGGVISHVLVRVGERMIVIFPEADIDLGAQPSDGNVGISSGYEMRDGRRQPYARFAGSPGQP